MNVFSDQIFYKALLLFTYKRIYGNALVIYYLWSTNRCSPIALNCRVNDLTVPYATSLIDTKDPFAYRNHTGLTV